MYSSKSHCMAVVHILYDFLEIETCIRYISCSISKSDRSVTESYRKKASKIANMNCQNVCLKQSSWKVMIWLCGAVMTPVYFAFLIITLWLRSPCILYLLDYDLKGSLPFVVSSLHGRTDLLVVAIWISKNEELDCFGGSSWQLYCIHLLRCRHVELDI